MPYVYRLSGDLNFEALSKALREIVRRHEALRTRFGELRGNPVQMIRQSLDSDLTVTDVRGEVDEAISRVAANLIVSERQAPFDLAVGPLIRTRLLWISNNEYLLLVTVHHIISDYWSMQIFRQELSCLYDAYAAGRPSSLRDPVFQFADYAAWERRMLDNRLFQTDVRFWRRKLTRLSNELTTEKTWEMAFTPTATEYVHVDETLCSSLRRLAREENCTLATIISAVVGIIIGHCKARKDILIGMLVANRGHPDLAHTIGNFTNTIIVRTQIYETMTARQVLRNVRSELMQAIAHQQYPLEDLLWRLGMRNFDYESLFQVLLSYQTSSPIPTGNSGITFAPFHISHIETTPTLFDMVCRLRETSTTLTGSVNWRTAAFHRGRGVRIGALLVKLLGKIAAFPDGPMSETLREAELGEC
jgi:NRPS condensation-like uncharacterized protein